MLVAPATPGVPGGRTACTGNTPASAAPAAAGTAALDTAAGASTELSASTGTPYRFVQLLDTFEHVSPGGTVSNTAVGCTSSWNGSRGARANSSRGGISSTGAGDSSNRGVDDCSSAGRRLSCMVVERLGDSVQQLLQHRRSTLPLPALRRNTASCVETVSQFAHTATGIRLHPWDASHFSWFQGSGSPESGTLEPATSGSSAEASLGASSCSAGVGLPLPAVRRMARHSLEALEHMHRCA